MYPPSRTTIVGEWVNAGVVTLRPTFLILEKEVEAEGFSAFIPRCIPSAC
jgi:hypothetical protein